MRKALDRQTLAPVECRLITAWTARPDPRDILDALLHAVYAPESLFLPQDSVRSSLPQLYQAAYRTLASMPGPKGGSSTASNQAHASFCFYTQACATLPALLTLTAQQGGKAYCTFA